MAENDYSYTKIDTFVQCGFKYKLKYVDKNFVSSKSIALELGTLVHAVEEDLANTLIAGNKIDYAAVKNKLICDLVKLESRYPVEYNSVNKSGKTYKVELLTYLDKGIYRLETFLKNNPSIKLVGAEVPFNFSYDDNHNFKGSIDRVLLDTSTNTYILQDLKTWHELAEHDKLTTPLQFVVYTMAAARLYNCDPDNIICQYNLPLLDAEQDAGTKGFMLRGDKKIKDIFSKICAGEFIPHPTSLCHWCDYCVTNPNAKPEVKMLCPYHSNWTPYFKDNSVANTWDGIANHENIFKKYLNLTLGTELEPLYTKYMRG